MKKHLILFFLFPLFGKAQNPGNYQLEGRISGLPENSWVFLTDANNPADTLSRTRVNKGVFILRGQLHEPTLVSINFDGPKKKKSVFIGNENVTMSGKVDELATLDVRGSSSEQDFITFEKTFNPYFLQINQLSQIANSPEGSSKRDSVSAVYRNLVVAIETQVDSFILQRRSSYVSPFLLVVVNQLSDDVFLLERRYKTLSPEVQQGMYGKYLSEQIENGKVGAIGTEALEFTQEDTAGHPVSLSSFKGKYVLIDFWASWCKPCRMENPNVVAAYERFKSKNFTVLGVSLDRSREAWIKAIQDDKLAWAQVSDLKFWNNAVAMQYRIQQIPQNILLDPNGKIIGKNLRGADLDSRLCALLGCN